MPRVPVKELPSWDSALIGEGMDGRAEKFTGFPGPELVHRKHCFGGEDARRPTDERATTRIGTGSTARAEGRWRLAGRGTHTVGVGW